MEENRPNPELLLKKLRKEEEKREKERKGKLKIFLGYAVRDWEKPILCTPSGTLF